MLLLPHRKQISIQFSLVQEHIEEKSPTQIQQCNQRRTKQNNRTVLTKSSISQLEIGFQVANRNNNRTVRTANGKS